MAAQSLSTLVIDIRERVEPTLHPHRRGFIPSRMIQRALEDMSEVTSSMGNAAVYYTVLLLPLALFCAIFYFFFAKTMKKVSREEVPL